MSYLSTACKTGLFVYFIYSDRYLATLQHWTWRYRAVWHLWGLENYQITKQSEVEERPAEEGGEGEWKNKKGDEREIKGRMRNGKDTGDG